MKRGNSSNSSPFETPGHNISSPCWPVGGVPGFNVVLAKAMLAFVLYPMLQLVPNPYVTAARAEADAARTALMEDNSFISCLFVARTVERLGYLVVLETLLAQTWRQKARSIYRNALALFQVLDEIPNGSK